MLFFAVVREPVRMGLCTLGSIEDVKESIERASIHERRPLPTKEAVEVYRAPRRSSLNAGTDPDEATPSIEPEQWLRYPQWGTARRGAPMRASNPQKSNVETKIEPATEQRRFPSREMSARLQRGLDDGLRSDDGAREWSRSTTRVRGDPDRRPAVVVIQSSEVFGSRIRSRRTRQASSKCS